MKKILFTILSLLLLFISNGCSTNTESKIRVRNDQLTKVNVKIFISQMNKSLISIAEGGKTSEYQTISEGNITATNTDQNESISFIAQKNTNYTIIISPGKPPLAQIDK